MGYASYPATNLGAGLRLDQKADAVGLAEAIDGLNVVFSDRGAISQRDGYSAFTSPALTNRAESLAPYYTTAGTKQLLAGCGTRLEAINTSGAVVASASGLTAAIWQFVRFGTPGAEVAYAGNANNLLRKWDGSTWASVASTPKAGALGVLGVSNRMVAARFDTTTGGPTAAANTSSPSHVYFSGQGTPDTWGADDYIILTPGDGEKVQAVIAWREFVFVFKESKFFVFYGESQDSDGTAIFDYRTVDSGVGAVGPKAVTANESGVFFADRRGVFVTTGGEPTLISTAVDPIFLGGSEIFFTGGELSHALISSVALQSVGRRVYLSYSTGGVYLDRTLVYDHVADWWTLFNLSANDIAGFRIGDQEEVTFAYATATKDIARSNATKTSDAGTAITSYWRGGFFDLDIPEIKRIPEQKVWGSGMVSCGVSGDYAQDTGDLIPLDMTTSTAVWGGSSWGGTVWASPTALTPRIRRSAIIATTVSAYFFNNVLDQIWSVHRFNHHLAQVRQPSIRKVAA